MHSSSARSRHAIKAIEDIPMVMALALPPERAYATCLRNMLTSLVARGPIACRVKSCYTAVVLVAWPDRAAIAGISLGFTLETFLAGAWTPL